MKNNVCEGCEYYRKNPSDLIYCKNQEDVVIARFTCSGYMRINLEQKYKEALEAIVAVTIADDFANNMVNSVFEIARKALKND